MILFQLEIDQINNVFSENLINRDSENDNQSLVFAFWFFNRMSSVFYFLFDRLSIFLCRFRRFILFFIRLFILMLLLRTVLYFCFFFDLILFSCILLIILFVVLVVSFIVLVFTLIEVIKNWVIVGSFQILTNCVTFINVTFRIEYFIEWRILRLFTLILDWSLLFHSHILSISIKFNNESFVLNDIIVLDIKLDSNIILNDVFNNLPVTFAFHFDDMVQNLVIFLREGKCHISEHRFPETWDPLRLHLIYTQGFCEIMLSIQLFLYWVSRGNFRNLIQKWLFNELEFLLNLSHFVVHFLIEILFFFFKFVNCSPGELERIVLVLDFLFNSIKKFLVSIRELSIKKILFFFFLSLRVVLFFFVFFLF